MKLKTFKGGVKPFESKDLTENKAIEKMPVPKTVVIPLSQHTGASATPVVVPKSKVNIGTKIGELQGTISANVHSSVSGTVKAIEPRFHPAGTLVPSVIIETSAPIKDTATDDWDNWEDTNYNSLSSNDIIERVKEAGIVGLGGTGFPTHIKLNPPKDKPVEIVILNGCECEPCLTGDYRLMLEKTKEILEGGKLILKAVGAKKGYIAIENNKMQAGEKFKEIAGSEFEICIMQTKYPEGGEKQLIKAITRREVPSGGLPFDVGCLVQNVGTAFAIYEACKYRKPLIERVVTVAGDVKEPKNLLVRIGTLFKDVIEYCGGATGIGKIIMGGPMMGIAQPDGEIPVVKATSGILVQNEKNVSLPLDEQCIRCGRCIESCPMGLLPAQIGDYIENKNFDEAKKLGLLDCIECGSCAWICPSKRNLVHLYKYGKIKVK